MEIATHFGHIPGGFTWSACKYGSNEVQYVGANPTWCHLLQGLSDLQRYVLTPPQPSQSPALDVISNGLLKSQLVLRSELSVYGAII